MAKFNFGEIPIKKKLNKPLKFKITKEISQNAKEKLMSFRNFDFKVFGGWILFLLAAIAITITVFYFINKIDQIEQRAQSERMENSIRLKDDLARIERVANIVISKDSLKERYMSYAKDIIRVYYINNRIPEHRQIPALEKDELLDLIFEMAHSGIYPHLKIPEGLFIPLSYLTVESNFVPFKTNKEYIEGEDGERSMFQFMIGTAREVYRRNGRTYVEQFWRYPKEYVWLFFEYYDRMVTPNFIHEDYERQVRWSAVGYNRGFYRNLVLPHFNQGFTLQQHFNISPLKKGSENYHNHIWRYYSQYREGFSNVIPLNN